MSMESVFTCGPKYTWAVYPFLFLLWMEESFLLGRKNGREYTQRESIQYTCKKGKGPESTVTLLRKAGWGACHSPILEGPLPLKAERRGSPVVRALGRPWDVGLHQVYIWIFSPATSGLGPVHGGRQLECWGGRAWALMGSSRGTSSDLTEVLLLWNQANIV